MGDSTPFRRVSKARPCPICQKPDWCLVAGPEGAPTVAICARIESGRRAGEAGWLHVLHADDYRRGRSVRTVRHQTAPPPPSLWRLAHRAAETTPAERLERLAGGLGITVASLRRLLVGWSTTHRAWTFPMRNGAGRIVGIRLRLPGGRKLAVRGGREGLFLPGDLGDGRRLLVGEGPTDTAAMLDLGFRAVGRPSCTGGIKHLARVYKLRKHVCSKCLVLRDLRRGFGMP